MDLARNLKKILKESAKIIFQGLFSPSIKREGKQTLKRQDNSSGTMYSPSPLTTGLQGTTMETSLTGTSEKITMETQIEPLNQVRDWALDRIESMTNQGDALALVAEFDEWIDVDENQEINYLCIEEEGWGDQEIDIR